MANELTDWLVECIQSDLPTEKKCLHPKKGFNVFFRKLCIPLQFRFAQVCDLSFVPKVFIHGNPHLDNLVQINGSSGLVDYDRSRIGPYSWDLLRFLGALAVRLRQPADDFLPENVAHLVSIGYLHGFQNPHVPYLQISSLNAIKPKPWQQNLLTYLDSNKKWACKLRAHPISSRDEKAISLLFDFFRSKQIQFADQYYVKQIAYVDGSFGKPHYVYLIADKLHHTPSKLIDIKECYLDADNEHFFSAFKHRGVEMIRASQLYSKGLEPFLGFATFKQHFYWGREICINKVQFKGQLDLEVVQDVALGVSSQLGRAHRLSLYGTEASHLIKHMQSNFSQIYEIAASLHRDLLAAYSQLIDQSNLQQEAS